MTYLSERWLNDKYETSFADLKNIKASKSEKERFKEENEIYSLYRQPRYTFKRMKTFGSGFQTSIQADLVDMSNLSEHNQGYNFILIAVDALSRKFYAIPVKNKSGKLMREALENLIKQTEENMQSLTTDAGKEFTNTLCQSLLDDYYITHYVIRNSAVKASLAERAILTLRNRMIKLMAHKKTKEWLPYLDQIIKNINNTVNIATGMRPSEVTSADVPHLFKKLSKQDGKKIEKKFKPGDTVRLAYPKKVFVKQSFSTGYTDQIYKIDQSFDTNPPTYSLTLENKPVPGRFYQDQFLKVRQDEHTKYSIEKILRRKKTRKGIQYLVRFYGYNDEYWVDENLIS